MTADTSMASNNFISAYYCTPNFTNVSFIYNGKNYSDIWVDAQLTQVAHINSSTSGTKTYDCSSYTRFRLGADNNQLLSESTNSTYYAMPSTYYPAYPSSMYMNTKGIIFSFDTAPTGSFLTWLNNNATLIPTS